MLDRSPKDLGAKVHKRVSERSILRCTVEKAHSHG